MEEYHEEEDKDTIEKVEDEEVDHLEKDVNEEDGDDEDSDMDEEDGDDEDSDMDEEDVNEEVEHEENENVGDDREADVVEKGNKEDNEDEDEDNDSHWLESDSDGSKEDRISLKDLKRQFELLDAECASSVPEEEYEEELQQGVWKSTPEEILWGILERLPIASQCRFRCVCSRWKVLLSRPFARHHGSQVESKPLYTIMSGSKSWFFSHAEEKWYRLPFQPEYTPYGSVQWMLEAVHRGLFCYVSSISGNTWLLVHNPMTGAFQIVPPYSSFPRSGLFVISFDVDKSSNSFKIVMPLLQFEETICYDSRTRLWTTFTGPGFHFRDIVIVRKYLIYCRYKEIGRYKVCDLRSEQLKWITVEANLPCNAEKRYHFVNNKNHVMLVQFHPTEIEAVRIWRLIDTEDASSLLLSRWKEVAVAVPDSMRPLISQIQRCWLHQNNFICFATDRANHWIKYTFATKAWRVMPCNRRASVKSNRFSSYLWLCWEPHLDRHVEPVEFDFSSCPEIADAYGRLTNNAPSR